MVHVKLSSEQASKLDVIKQVLNSIISRYTSTVELLIYELSKFIDVDDYRKQLKEFKQSLGLPAQKPDSNPKIETLAREILARSQSSDVDRPCDTELLSSYRPCDTISGIELFIHRFSIWMKTDENETVLVGSQTEYHDDKKPECGIQADIEGTVTKPEMLAALCKIAGAAYDRNAQFFEFLKAQFPSFPEFESLNKTNNEFIRSFIERIHEYADSILEFLDKHKYVTLVVEGFSFVIKSFDINEKDREEKHLLRLVPQTIDNSNETLPIEDEK